MEAKSKNYTEKCQETIIHLSNFTSEQLDRLEKLSQFQQLVNANPEILKILDDKNVLFAFESLIQGTSVTKMHFDMFVYESFIYQSMVQNKAEMHMETIMALSEINELMNTIIVASNKPQNQVSKSPD